LNPKKFKKGKHFYTDWGGGVKEVKKVTEEKKQQQIQIKLDEETAMGHFANLASISHTREEFIFDFVFMGPGAPAKVVSRIITSPGHAKRLMLALTDNVKKYEGKHGQIMPSREPDKKIGF